MSLTLPDTNKSVALSLIQLAAMLLPPLANLIRVAVDAFESSPNEDERSLAADIRRILPQTSESANVLAELEGRQAFNARQPSTFPPETNSTTDK